MLIQTLNALTNAQKAELRALGISDQLRSDWLHERRLPTPAQGAILEVMGGLPAHSLRDWLMQAKATPEQKEWLARALGKARGAVVMLLCGVVAVVGGAASDNAYATADHNV